MSKSKSRVKKSRAFAQPDPFAPESSTGEPSSQAALEALSLPPVTDDVSHEGFFSRDSSPPEDDELSDDELMKERALRQTPEVRARIARAQRIVTGLVAAAALVTLAGFGSKALRSGPTASAAQASQVVAPMAALAVEAPKPASEPAKLEPKPAEVAPATEAPKLEAPKPEVVAEKPTAPSAPPAAPSAAADAPTKSALEEKKDAQRWLDRGKSKDAIAAGERSVALDPADGEAWLLLGAAYQEQGKMADARRCYQSCLKEGKRGPKGECSAMLR